MDEEENKKEIQSPRRCMYVGDDEEREQKKKQCMNVRKRKEKKEGKFHVFERIIINYSYHTIQ